MNPLLPFARDELLQRNAHRVIVLFLGTAILVTPFYLYLALQTGAWQLVLLAAGVLMLDVASAVSLSVIRRGWPARAVGLVVAAILALLLIASLLINQLGVPAGLIAVIVTLAIATQTLPPRALNRTLLASLIAAVAAGLLDLWGPPFQLVVPGLRTLTLVVAGLLTLLFAVIITRQFRAYHLSTKLIIIFLVFTLVPVALLAHLGSLSTRALLRQGAAERLREAANHTAGEVDAFIQTNLDLVQAEAGLPLLSTYLSLPPGERAGSAAQSQVLATLRALQSRDAANIDAYALLDSEGQVVVTTAAPESDRDRFRAPAGAAQTLLPQSQAYVSPVLFMPGSREPSLFFSSPVRGAGGDVLGVLLLRYNAAILQQIVARSSGRAGPGSFAVLFDENTTRLAHGAAPEVAFTLLAPLEPGHVIELQAAGRLPDGPAGSLLLPSPALAETLAAGRTAATPDPANATAPIPLVGDPAGDPVAGEHNQVVAVTVESQPWQVAFFQPQQHFLAPVAAQTRWTILFSILIAGAVAAGTVAVSQRLTAPILHLTEVAARVREGDLTAQAPVARSDEIGLLAFTFNTMTAQLRDLINTLEQRVADRTRALATSTEVSRRLSTILDQQQLVKEVVEQVQSAFNYYHVHIYLFDEKEENLIMAGGTGEAGRSMLAAGHSLAKGKGLVGRAGAGNTAVLVPDVTREPAWLPNPLLPQTRAEAAVPIAIGDRVLGVLDVQHHLLHGLQQQDVELLQSIANQIAVALRNAQLFGQVQQQSQELLLVNRVVSAVAASMDLQHSMQIIATELARAVGVEQTGIALINPDGKSLTVVAEHLDESSSSSALGLVLPVEGNALTEQVLATRRPVVVTDAQHNPLTAPVHDVMRRRRVQTLVILPMIAGDAVIGTVGLDSLRENHGHIQWPTPEQLRLAETIIFQAAAAVQNARLFEQTQAALAETQRRSRELALINEVVAAVAASLDLQASLDTICARLAQAVDVQQVRIALLNEDKSKLTVVAEQYDESRAASALGFVIPVAGNALTQQVLEGRQPVIVTDAQRNPLTAPVHEGMREQGIESLVVLPILAGNEVIGTVGLDILEKNRVLSAEALQVAETIVFQVATAVQNAQLFQQTEARARQLALINQVAQAVSQQLELDQLLNTVYQEIRHVMPADAFMVALAYAGGNTVHYPFVFDSGRRYQHPPAPLSPHFKLHQVIIEGAPIRLNRSREEVARAQAQASPARVGDSQKVSASLLYVPLRLGAQSIGALSVQSYEYNAYDEADEAILVGIASYVAVALENSQLFEQTQTALAETDLLYQASASLNAAQSYDDVLSTLRQHTALGQQAAGAHLARLLPPAEGAPGHLAIVARWGDDRPRDPAAAQVHLADKAILRRLHSGQPLLVADLADAPWLDAAAPTGQDVQSALLMPLLVGRRQEGAAHFLGVAAFFYRTAAAAFPDRELRHLAALAGQAAITMQTIHLLEETNRLLSSEQRQRRIADTLLRAAGRMAESLSQSELRRIMLEQIGEILLPEAANLYEWVEGENAFRLDQQLGPAAGDTNGGRPEPLVTPEARPALWQVFSQRSPLLESREGQGGQPRHYLCLPWFAGATAMGVVELVANGAPGATAIGDEEIARCQGVVRQAAIALQNARTYEQEQARARREQILRHIASRVRGSADVDTIMRAAVQEIGRALGRRAFLTLAQAGNAKGDQHQDVHDPTRQ